MRREPPPLCMRSDSPGFACCLAVAGVLVLAAIGAAWLVAQLIGAA